MTERKREKRERERTKTILSTEFSGKLGGWSGQIIVHSDFPELEWSIVDNIPFERKMSILSTFECTIPLSSVFFWHVGVVSENQAEFEILTPRGAGCFYAESAPPKTHIKNGSKSSQ